MAFGKKKVAISNKVTQTHRISLEGILDIQPDGRILMEIEDLGVVSLARVLADMDSRVGSLAVASKQEDYLSLDLSDDEDDHVDVLDATDFDDEEQPSWESRR